MHDEFLRHGMSEKNQSDKRESGVPEEAQVERTK
jgi:hypothetical protein